MDKLFKLFTGTCTFGSGCISVSLVSGPAGLCACDWLAQYVPQLHFAAVGHPFGGRTP